MAHTAEFRPRYMITGNKAQLSFRALQDKFKSSRVVLQVKLYVWASLAITQSFLLPAIAEVNRFECKNCNCVPHSSLAHFPDAVLFGFFSAICFIQHPRRLIQETTTAWTNHESVFLIRDGWHIWFETVSSSCSLRDVYVHLSSGEETADNNRAIKCSIQNKYCAE